MKAENAKKTVCMVLAAFLVVSIFAYAVKAEAQYQEITAKKAALEAEQTAALLLAEKLAKEEMSAKAAEAIAEKEAEERAAKEAEEARKAREAAEAAEKEAAMQRPYVAPYVESEAEKRIFSYVQNLPEDYPDSRWAGYWARLEAGGQQFCRFGCGICCLSNVVSTFRGMDINPAKMFWMAQELTNYRPKGGRGAIDWTQMAKVLNTFALVNESKRKPSSCAKFGRDVAEADATIVLVCKDNDDSLWFYTNGHYVTLWNYDPNDGTVFVSDSAGLYNRQRVSLAAVYRALKTGSTAQYMTIYRKAPAKQ